MASLVIMSYKTLEVCERCLLCILGNLIKQ